MSSPSQSKSAQDPDAAAYRPDAEARRSRGATAAPTAPPSPAGRSAELPRPLRRLALPIVFAALALATSATFQGCAHPNFFPGTTILKNDENQKILDTIELYRTRLTERNVEGLLVLASDKYREDSGTPRSDDDYGYQGLKDILKNRLGGLRSLWYEIELRDIRVHDQQADVDVFLNGSFELASQSSGDRYRRVNDYHRFVLERDGDGWKFLSGM